jgi:archaellum component FlaC
MTRPVQILLVLVVLLAAGNVVLLMRSPAPEAPMEPPRADDENTRALSARVDELRSTNRDLSEQLETLNGVIAGLESQLGRMQREAPDSRPPGNIVVQDASGEVARLEKRVRELETELADRTKDAARFKGQRVELIDRGINAALSNNHMDAGKFFLGAMKAGGDGSGELGRSNAELAVMSMMSFLRAGEYGVAYRTLVKALHANPRLLQEEHDLIAMFGTHGNMLAFLRELEADPRRFENDLEMSLLMGVASDVAGAEADAVRHYNRVRQLDPENQMVNWAQHPERAPETPK